MSDTKKKVIHSRNRTIVHKKRELEKKDAYSEVEYETVKSIK